MRPLLQLHVALSALLVVVVGPHVAVGQSTAEVVADLGPNHPNCVESLDDSDAAASSLKQGECAATHKEQTLLREDGPELPCGVWFAPSTIPGAGMGMFSGRHFEKGQELLPTGDVVIPIVDIAYHQDDRRRDYNFLWDEYTWDSETLRMDHEGYDVHAASPGYGAAANSFLDLVNVDEHLPTQEDGMAGLHRSRDPGAGAFTTYHDRRSTATMDIEPGQEFFVSYGNNWFETRAKYMGEIPLYGHLHVATRTVINTYKRIEQKYNDTMPNVVQALRDRFVVNRPVTSHILNALPNSEEELEVAKKVGLVQLRRQQATVDLDWLQRHGTCADNLRVGRSTLFQAGRGAFATRFLPKGSVVAPIPLIHLVDGQRYMEQYQLEQEGDEIVISNTSKVVGKQLLINYCLGHPESSLLLSPYGSMTSVVNHNRTRANVELKWGDPRRSNHQPEWLDKTFTDLRRKSSTVLAMEFVATRDIMEGEEILLDYGEAWEEAWNHHVATWTPFEGADKFKTAGEMNNDTTSILRTEFEQIKDPYPSNLELKCFDAFRGSAWKKYKNDLAEFLRKREDDNEVVECDILRYKKVGDDILYTVLLTEDDPPVKMTQVPREAFVFVDKPHASDMHLPNAFRHEIGIPDHLFPEHWKDKRTEQSRNL